MALGGFGYLRGSTMEIAFGAGADGTPTAIFSHGDAAPAARKLRVKPFLSITVVNSV